MGSPTVSGWQRFGVVLTDNLLMVVAFLPGFLTGIATGFGATGWPGWAAPTLVVLGVLMGVGVLVLNGGVLAGRGRSIGMHWLSVSLVDEFDRRAVGTARALVRSILCLAFNRVGAERSFAERQTGTVLLRGDLVDLKEGLRAARREPPSRSLPSMYRD
ncbi:RDD family protein [Nocardioides sambongensis]|uniref:RDD family protein n=1 Tax=Nocardioides sambongensis TaxID=2589074 RepID=UPI001E59C11B|nr:RDD family protein [Nocardioides sambongensis]